MPAWQLWLCSSSFILSLKIHTPNSSSAFPRKPFCSPAGMWAASAIVKSKTNVHSTHFATYLRRQCDMVKDTLKLDTHRFASWDCNFSTRVVLSKLFNTSQTQFSTCEEVFPRSKDLELLWNAQQCKQERIQIFPYSYAFTFILGLLLEPTDKHSWNSNTKWKLSWNGYSHQHEQHTSVLCSF